MKSPKQRNPKIDMSKLLSEIEDISIFDEIPSMKIESFLKDLYYNIDKYSAGETIVEEGQEFDYFGIIIEGEIIESGNGNPQSLKKGNEIGLLEQIMDSKKFTKMYSAKTDCLILWCRLKHYIAVSQFVTNNDYNPFVENLLRQTAESAIKAS